MKIACLLALNLLVIGPFAGAQELTKEAKIEHLLTVMNADNMIDQMFEQIKAMTAAQVPPGTSPEQVAQARQVQTKIMDLVKARISWEKMRPQYVKLYAETFSDEEISGMLAFIIASSCSNSSLLPNFTVVRAAPSPSKARQVAKPR